MKRSRRTTVTTPKFLIAGVLTLIFVIALSFGTERFYSDAKAADNIPAEVKYYKSVKIQKGDSLWSIAKEYMNDNYDSVYDYIDELVILNQLEDREINQIQEGDYLTVAYYTEAGR